MPNITALWHNVFRLNPYLSGEEVGWLIQPGEVAMRNLGGLGASGFWVGMAGVVSGKLGGGQMVSGSGEGGGLGLGGV